MRATNRVRWTIVIEYLYLGFGDLPETNIVWHEFQEENEQRQIGIMKWKKKQKKKLISSIWSGNLEVQVFFIMMFILGLSPTNVPDAFVAGILFVDAIRKYLHKYLPSHLNTIISYGIFILQWNCILGTVGILKLRGFCKGSKEYSDY